MVSIGRSRVWVTLLELIQVLSRDLLSVHGARAAHCDGAGLEKGCDVSITKQHLRFFETAATVAPHVELDESCVRSGAVRGDAVHQVWSCPVINAFPHDDIRKIPASFPARRA